MKTHKLHRNRNGRAEPLCGRVPWYSSLVERDEDVTCRWCLGMIPDPLQLWNVYDSDGTDAEEAMPLLIAAATSDDAIGMWPDLAGVLPGDYGEITADPVKWLWDDVPEPPRPIVPGLCWPKQMTPRGPAFEGYGFVDERSSIPAQIRAVLAQMNGCMDHSCVVKKPTGMGTNGGCRCPTDEDRRHLRHLLQLVRRL